MGDSSQKDRGWGHHYQRGFPPVNTWGGDGKQTLGCRLMTAHRQALAAVVLCLQPWSHSARPGFSSFTDANCEDMRFILNWRQALVNLNFMAPSCREMWSEIFSLKFFFVFIKWMCLHWCWALAWVIISCLICPVPYNNLGDACMDVLWTFPLLHVNSCWYVDWNIDICAQCLVSLVSFRAHALHSASLFSFSDWFVYSSHCRAIWSCSAFAILKE